MEWYYSDDDAQRGPLSDDELQAAYDSGMVTPSTLVWSEGMAEWLPFGQVVDLTGGAPAAVPAPGPPLAADLDETVAAPVPAPAAAGGAPKKAKSRGKGLKKKGKKLTAGKSRSRGSATGVTRAAKTGATRSPYAAPKAELATGGEDAPVKLAGPMDRLIAVFLDMLVGFVVMLPMLGFFTKPSQTGVMVIVGLSLCIFIGLVIVQIRYILKYSATIGKKFMNIFIADMQGQPASAGKIIGLRGFVNGMICNIPGYALVDLLFIFRSDRRCIHDLIAGTQVLKKF